MDSRGIKRLLFSYVLINGICITLQTKEGKRKSWLLFKLWQLFEIKMFLLQEVYTTLFKKWMFKAQGKNMGYWYNVATCRSF